MSTITLLHDPEELEDLEEQQRRMRRRARTVVRAGVSEPDNLTLEELVMAIAHRIDVPEEDAFRDASFVMDIFGFDERIIDNVLEREDRQLFYLLEETGMLTTAREETTIWDGREWRTHYWVLKKRAIKSFAAAQRDLERRRREPTEGDVYGDLPQNAWRERRF